MRGIKESDINICESDGFSDITFCEWKLYQKFCDINFAVFISYLNVVVFFIRFFASLKIYLLITFLKFLTFSQETDRKDAPE